jgi:protein CpxP
MKPTLAIAALALLCIGLPVFADAPSPATPAVTAIQPTPAKAHGLKRLNELATYLNLTPDQTSQIQTIMMNTQSKIRALKLDTTLTPDQARAQTQAARKDQRQQIDAVLTPDQKAKYTEFMRSHRKASPTSPVITPGTVPVQ